MITKKNKKKAFELIKLMQEQPHKEVSITEANSFCAEDNFFEIIKYLKYYDFMENGNQGYVLKKQGYNYTPFKHALKFLKKQILL